MTQESKSDEYYPFRWKVADAVEDIFLLHRAQAIGVIALLGLGFIILGFFLLGWGSGNTRTDTASPTTTIPSAVVPADDSDDQSPTTVTSTSSSSTSTNTTSSTTTTTTTTAAPTTTAPVSTRPVATAQQIAAAEAGAVIELTPQSVRLVGGVSSEADADAVVDLTETIFANLEIEDLQLVDDSFAEFDASDSLKFRLSAPDLFGYNSATLNAAYLPLIDSLAATLVDNESWEVEVSGHTDDTGPAPGNQRLSEGRSASAAQRLIDQGVPASRVSSIGRGEDQPVATNDTEAGRLANRRVEFVVTR